MNRAHKASEQDTSVSALVKRFLAKLAASESDAERLNLEERALRERIGSLRAADRLPREGCAWPPLMNGLRFFDTGIFLYSISRDPAEASKCTIAIALLDTENIALSMQVLQEFYVQAIRATRVDALAHEIVVGLVRTWLRFKVQEIFPDRSSPLSCNRNWTCAGRRRCCLLEDHRRTQALPSWSLRCWRRRNWTLPSLLRRGRTGPSLGRSENRIAIPHLLAVSDAAAFPAS